MGKTHLAEHDMVRRVDPNGEALVWCRKVFGLYSMPFCAGVDEPLQTRQKKDRRELRMLEKFSNWEEREIPDRKAEGWKTEGEKKIVTRKEWTRLREEFEDESFMAQEELRNIANKKNVGRQRGVA